MMAAEIKFLHQLHSTTIHDQEPIYSMAQQFHPPTLQPSVPIKVHIGLTVVFTALYGLLFLLIMWQLWLILHYGHRRRSYQSVFLFACLLWAALRTVLFSFYFQNCSETNMMGPFFSWLLFAFPVFLQYFMLNVLVLYFVKVSCVGIPSPRPSRVVLFSLCSHLKCVNLTTQTTCITLSFTKTRKFASGTLSF